MEPDTAATRILGRVTGGPGPVLVAVGGMHGNEPAGVEALERVLATLDRESYPIRGSFLALRGNGAALRHHRRFVDCDLNRHWTRDNLEAARRSGADDATDPVLSEDRDLVELHDLILEALAEAEGETHVIDLHTTSGQSAPFGTVGDTLRNRSFALSFPIPLIMGLEEHLEGTMLEYMNDRGHITLGLEGGRHLDPVSVDRLEAGVWLALSVSGVLSDPAAASQVTRARGQLAQAGARLPRVIEVRHRHFVSPHDEFAMRPGYASFQHVATGEHLADDDSGPVLAPESGLILMPLYQPDGDDGFFIAREFKRFWLGVSALLRRLHLDRLLPVFPGVRNALHQPDTLLIDGRVARWFALEVFHLLGYRKRRRMGDLLVVKRRREAPADKHP